MKSITFVLSFFLLNICIGQSLFKTVDRVDEFGDKVGEAQQNVAMGTFSNTATNSSELKVYTVLEQAKDFTLEEYKEYQTKEYKRLGFDDKFIKNSLKYAKRTFEIYKNALGTITFSLLEYGDHSASVVGVDYGTISIKTEDGTKIKATLKEASFSHGSVTITAYKELTTGLSGIKNQIKYGVYDWSQTDIYNAIVNATGSVDVFIYFSNSTYSFKLEQ